MSARLAETELYSRMSVSNTKGIIMQDHDSIHCNHFVGNRQIDVTHFYSVAQNVFSVGYFTGDIYKFGIVELRDERYIESTTSRVFDF